MFEKRYKTAKWLLFTLLIYGILISVLSRFVYFDAIFALNPIYLLQTLLGWWVDLRIPLIIVFTLLPLCGWFLCRTDRKAGKYLIITPHTVLLSLNLVIFILHLINALYMYRGESLLDSFLSFLITGVYSVLVIALTMIWRPKRDF